VIHSVDGWAAIVHLLRVRVGLRVRLARHSLDEVLERLSRMRQPLTFAEVERALTYAEVIVAKLPWIGASCLYRSLGRFALLRAHGWPAVFVMGVSKNESSAGHAWVELGGAPYRESGTEAFVVTFRFPAAPAEAAAADAE
jgi:hypothetical protein